MIGAGVAGLTAASKLIQSGNFSVTLLEASNRIGGRVFTDKFGKGDMWYMNDSDKLQMNYIFINSYKSVITLLIMT